MTPDEPVQWSRLLGRTLADLAHPVVGRVVVLPEVSSTQDAAFGLSGGAPGLLLLAARQTSGRGRLGRSWHQRGQLGLAVTFVLDAAEFPPERLSLAAGLAAASALDGLVRNSPRLGLRWPNDVVEPLPQPGGGRKVAGVLIEVRDDLALVGVGINVGQEVDDFPEELRGKAASLRMLGADASRIQVADALLRSVNEALALTPGRLAAEWVERDVLGGSTQTFVHEGKRIRGVVESIDPAHEIIVRAGDVRVRLPALTTSLVGDFSRG